jgi:S1-C subfamily serine protease
VVDVVDIVLVVLLVAAAVHGLRLGALVQVFTFVGFLIGLTGGALLAIALGSAVHSPPVRQVLALSLVMGLAVLCGIAGRVVGTWTHVVVRRHHLGKIDSALGVAVAVVAVLISSWLVANVVAGNSRYVWLDSAVQRSDILRSVDQVLPPAPSIFSRVQSFLASEGFPAVFADPLSAPNAADVPVPGRTEAQRIATTAAFSTVKVVGDACGYQQEGSGFVVGHGLVVTNAHVVAGEHQTTLEVGAVTYRATVVLYDPAFDLALLRTSAPLGPVLTLSNQIASRGTQGAVLGYPENGPLTVSAAGVTANIVAEGRDIYGNGLVTRDFYSIDAQVLPGNSGGPLVDASGKVVGMVFSRSTVYPGVGYALASPGVLSRVQQGEGQTHAVSTGGCVGG